MRDRQKEIRKRINRLKAKAVRPYKIHLGCHMMHDELINTSRMSSSETIWARFEFGPYAGTGRTEQEAIGNLITNRERARFIERRQQAEVLEYEIVN